MKKFISKYRITIVGCIAGIIAGYAYYFFIGCSSGSCMITSSPINSSIYGAFMGGLLFDGFRIRKIENKQIKQQTSE